MRLFDVSMALGLLGLISPATAQAEPCPSGIVGDPGAPPTTSSGTAVVANQASTELSGEEILAPGWRLRTRTITFAPGAIVSLHSHDKRPEMATMLVGTVMIYQLGCKLPIAMRPHEVHSNGRGVAHWAVNESKEFAVMYVTDLVAEESFPITDDHGTEAK